MNKYPITIVLEDIRSALNVGAIFRTCDAGNIQELYLCGITPYPPHNRIPKTALGSVDFVDWHQNKDTSEVTKNLTDSGVTLYSIEITDDSKDLFQEEIDFPAAFVFGNEITGVSDNVQRISHKILHIPMYGRKESLNIATACGIVIYELIRKYNVKNSNRKI
ncbi:TrmH family RNA methyltransferase [Candidatus Dojkabacteria bacterium]|nr:TrmH family RNA methyltransferase [Candidatus Dojkabacteria bacterium]